MIDIVIINKLARILKNIVQCEVMALPIQNNNASFEDLDIHYH
jgi:hypothetical protein